DNAVRVRLGSIAISVGNGGSAASPASVEIVYSRADQLFALRAKHCVLACWNMMIPYLCPQLPQKQKEALSYLVQGPLSSTHVALSNWRAFASLRIDRVHCPGSSHTSVRLTPVTDIGTYRAPRSLDEPILIQMVRTPCWPGMSERDQHRMGR